MDNFFRWFFAFISIIYLLIFASNKDIDHFLLGGVGFAIYLGFSSLCEIDKLNKQLKMKGATKK